MVWRGDIVAKYIEILKEKQIQPSGVDLTVDKIYKFAGEGVLSEEQRIMPLEEIEPDKEGFWKLEKGAYLVRYSEIVEIPKNAIGLVFPRSSLMRMGCTITTAVWDPGYKGRGVGLLIVQNPHGIRIKRGTRIAQIIFISAEALDVYRGAWQFEGIEKKEVS